MRFAVNFLQSFDTDVCVNLRCVESGVSEELLE